MSTGEEALYWAVDRGGLARAILPPLGGVRLQLIVSRARAAQIGRAFTGTLLLLPALLAFGVALWLPVLRVLVRAALAGPAVWAQAWLDSLLGLALCRSVQVGLVRAAAVGLVGMLACLTWLRFPHVGESPSPCPSPSGRGDGGRAAA
ncbi:MAG: hypothetical protein ACUVX9_16615, partial [Anaerolineae bacterium]